MSDSGTAALPASDGSRSATFLSSRLMIGAITFFFAVVVFVALLDLYARMRWGRRVRRRRRIVFFADRDDASAHRGGLPVELLKALPIHIFKSSDAEEAPECAVCLSEVGDGEKVRLLPPCRHCFHVDCIDMWFHSHSTCPLCRNPVAVAVGDTSTDPTAHGVLGNDAVWVPHDVHGMNSAALLSTTTTTTTTRSDGALVIEIPRRVLDAFTSPASSPRSSSRRVGDIIKSMSPTAASAATPMSRLRSLTRMMSWEKRAAVSPSFGSPRGEGGDDPEIGLSRSLSVDVIGTSAGGAKTQYKNL